MHNILYICFYHSIDDARLYYRQAKWLKERSPDLRVGFLHRYFRKPFDPNFELESPEIDFIPVSWAKWKHDVLTGSSANQTLIGKVYRRAKTKMVGLVANIASFVQQYRLAISYQPDVIQVSDVRELAFGVTLKWITGSKLVYDVHEVTYDFIYQIIGKPKIFAAFMAYLERLLVTFTDVIFCASEDYNAIYEQYVSKDNSVHAFHNFISPDLVKSKALYQDTKSLNIVYIGTINKYRGVLEAAEFVNRFNTEHNPEKELRLHIYAPKSGIVSQIAGYNSIRIHGVFGFDELMSQLIKYDIGICTLLPIEKYKKSIPMKNFEYMAVGLPIITSDFGYCKQYVQEAGCGICIDPTSYEQFQKAIMKMYDANIRKRMGLNGLNYLKSNDAVKNERQTYLNAMLGEKITDR